MNKAWVYMIVALHCIAAPIFAAVKNITLVGAIQIHHNIHALEGLPVLYKGCEVNVEVPDDGKKAYFEIYDEEKPRILYMVITQYLKEPSENSVQHLCTSPEYAYRLFKLTRSYSSTPVDLLKLASFDQETWAIEELDNSEKEYAIPDNAIIIFMPSEVLDCLDTNKIVNAGTTLQLPTLVLKPEYGKKLKDITERANLAFVDFKALHKKPYKAYMPYASNHILSMPFTPRHYA